MVFSSLYCCLHIAFTLYFTGHIKSYLGSSIFQLPQEYHAALMQWRLSTLVTLELLTLLLPESEELQG